MEICPYCQSPVERYDSDQCADLLKTYFCGYGDWLQRTPRCLTLEFIGGWESLPKAPCGVEYADCPTSEQVASDSPAAWVVEMHEYFREHGHFRQEDIVRVTGDPTKGVEMPTPEDSLPELFQC